jgi:hypothetical protein
MEVHHHPEVERKRLKDYLLEGLMIFVAVTMGFFAESFREHINDKEKEQHYIVSFVNNLKEDTTGLNETIEANQVKLIGLDSLLSLAYADFNDTISRKLLYKYASSSVSSVNVFFSSDATMLQLKNSGGLQYIKHDHIADSIAEYDQQVRGIYAAEGAYTKSIYNALDALSELIYFNKNNTDNRRAISPAININEHLFLSKDPEKIVLFFNKIALERGWVNNYIKNLQERVPIANGLLLLLKKEYDIE